MSDKPMRTRRLLHCAACGLAEAVCMCNLLPRIATQTRVMLVIHKSEVAKSTNTGRLLPGVLENVDVFVRGQKGIASPPIDPSRRRLLLFPLPEARRLGPSDAGPAPVLLIIPDGTWGQARRVRQREAIARDAEIVALPAGGPSRYPLRRTDLPGAVCTFEAAARALGILEGPPVEEQMVSVLDEFVRRALQTRAGYVRHVGAPR